MCLRGHLPSLATVSLIPLRWCTEQALDHAGKVLGSLRTLSSNRLVRALSVLYERGLVHVEKLLEDAGLWRLARWLADAVASNQAQLQHDLDLYQYYAQTSRTGRKKALLGGVSPAMGSTHSLLSIDDLGHSGAAAASRAGGGPDIRRIHPNAALRLRRVYAQLMALCTAVTKMKCGYVALARGKAMRCPANCRRPGC